MKTQHTLPDHPSPSPDKPAPPDRDVPAVPRRRRIHQPVFRSRLFAARTFLLAALLGTSSLSTAQNTGTPNAPATARPTPPTQGWVLFNDDVGRTLQLKADQLQRLRDTDARFGDRYRGLGEEPWTNKGYGTLTDEREHAVREILTPDQYDTWVRTYGAQRTSVPPPGATTPR